MGAEGRPLVDPQGRSIDYLRVSLTDRCNYACTYCVPADGVEHAPADRLLSVQEIVALVEIFVRVGVRRVRLSGGEPTLRRDLPALVGRLRKIDRLEEIALSTNGHRLEELAVPLRQAGVDRLNVSLDSLDPERFRRITGRGDLTKVLRGLAAARAAGFRSIKLNTVAIAGFNEDEVTAIAAFAWAEGFVPRFIEEMPMAGGRTHRPGAGLSAAEIRTLISRVLPGGRVVADDGGRDRGGGPARYFQLLEPAETPQQPTHRRFGIISPMTEHFCASCNRLRLSATGALHPCLAYDDAVDLLEPLRAGGAEAVAASIERALLGKRDGHRFDLIGLGGPRKAMIQIGG